MIYTILSLFAFCQLSAASRRLLQQGAPQYIPIGSGTTTTAAGGGAAPGTVILPTTTQATVVLPGQGGPGGIVLPPLPEPAPLVKECTLMYNEPGSCAGQITTIGSPRQNFKLKCGATGSCAQSTITFDYPPGGFASRIEGLWFTEAYAGWGTTVIVNNQQGGNVVSIERLECQGPTACQDLTIILNNAAVNDVECGYPQDCANCFIKQGALDPAPKPCYGW